MDLNVKIRENKREGLHKIEEWNSLSTSGERYVSLATTLSSYTTESLARSHSSILVVSHGLGIGHDSALYILERAAQCIIVI